MGLPLTLPPSALPLSLSSVAGHQTLSHPAHLALGRGLGPWNGELLQRDPGGQLLRLVLLLSPEQERGRATRRMGQPELGLWQQGISCGGTQLPSWGSLEALPRHLHTSSSRLDLTGLGGAGCCCLLGAVRSRPPQRGPQQAWAVPLQLAGQQCWPPSGAGRSGDSGRYTSPQGSSPRMTGHPHTCSLGALCMPEGRRSRAQCL